MKPFQFIILVNDLGLSRGNKNKNIISVFVSQIFNYTLVKVIVLRRLQFDEYDFFSVILHFTFTLEIPRKGSNWKSSSCPQIIYWFLLDKWRNIMQFICGNWNFDLLTREAFKKVCSERYHFISFGNDDGRKYIKRDMNKCFVKQVMKIKKLQN